VGVIPRHIFRAYDIRGIFEKEITPETAVQIGKGFGTYIGGEGKKLVIGRDVRLSGQVLEKALTRGMISTGCEVLDVGVVPTPVLSFSVVRYDGDGGVAITASHNPPEWNGFKLFKRGGVTCAQGTGMENVEKIIFAGKFKTSKNGKAENYKWALADYADFVEGKVDIGKTLKVTMDAGNGTCGLIAPELFRRFDCEVVSINMEPDGRFPAHLPEPKEETLTDLMRMVPDEGAAFGVGYDGDGDRAVFVDDRGRMVPGDVTLTVFSDYYLEKNKNAKIIFDVSCSSSVEEAIKMRGGIPIVSRVGRAFIVDKMKSEGAIFGGEESSHFYFSEIYGFDDGVFSSLKMAEILSKRGDKLSEIVDAIPRYPSTPTLNFDCPDEKKFRVVEALKRDFKKSGHETVDIDGVKVILPDGWFLIRPSNTMPQVRITAEAKTTKKLEEIVDFAKKRLTEKIGEVV